MSSRDSFPPVRGKLLRDEPLGPFDPATAVVELGGAAERCREDGR